MVTPTGGASEYYFDDGMRVQWEAVNIEQVSD
jgi:hypothetical protein